MPWRDALSASGLKYTVELLDPSLQVSLSDPPRTE